MNGYVVELEEVDRHRVAEVGGKGAALGELGRIEGVAVPGGFCVTTRAFARALAEAPAIAEGVERLSRLHPGDREAIAALSADLRRAVGEIAVPAGVASAIGQALARHGEEHPYAVRSSATAEDAAAASFAGQHDSYLDVAGEAAIREHVRRCWASLFSERAVAYRLRNGVGHRDLQMAVVVQRMVPARAAGVLFTADPVTGHRKVAAVEAVLGLGEALVSGRVTPDTYEVRDGAVNREPGDRPVLTDAQVLDLVALGRRIEAHFGRPQDVEWCHAGDRFHIVQSRPITTLFPIPEQDDDENHVYISVGHQQMMTDAMKPLGLSVWLLTTRARMRVAGGRLFVDVAPALATPAGREGLLKTAGRSDPLVGDALQSIIDRGDYVRPVPGAGHVAPPAGGPPAPAEPDPAVVGELIRRSEESVAALEREIRGKSGSALLEFILADLQELKRVLFDPRVLPVIMAGMEATWWINEQMQAWLGEKNAADALTHSAPHNVSAEMGLALLEVADVVRAHPEVVAFLRRADGDLFLDDLPALAGGREAADAIRGYLDRYGMRCVGEIDITRPRWAERPGALVPMLLHDVEHFEPGEAQRRFERGRREAIEQERHLLERVRALPGGEGKAEEVKRMIDRIRAFTGYREYPKYGIVSRYFAYKQALMEEAGRLVRAGVLREREDVFFLWFEELQEVVRTGRADEALIRRRRDEFAAYEALTPPRVLTSDGECLDGAYRRDDLPAGALGGLAVSAGTVEGRARIIRDVAEADLEPGDILVTAYTDPSWAPLFVAIEGLVTEVGGLMTHGAVVAREYGLPAVVGVPHATERIRDGQRIRVHGTDGYVEFLA